jgi:5-(carboxyamino)imidazole ribonucleotide mutase
MRALVGIIMGSASDWETMQGAADILDSSASRTRFAPSRPIARPTSCSNTRRRRERGPGATIAGAGGAAHLPGMTAAKTSVPVLGVPIQSKVLKGTDSLLSIAQMPSAHRLPRLPSALPERRTPGRCAAILANEYVRHPRGVDAHRQAQPPVSPTRIRQP